MKRFLWILSGVVLVSGLLFLDACGGGGSSTTRTTPPAISVSLTPSPQTNLDQGQELYFTAAVSNDSSSKGVTWSMSGKTCTGSACGTFTNTDKTGATYNAPATVSAGMTVTVQATSVADTSKSASATVSVTPAPSITTTKLSAGTVGKAYSATLKASGGAGALTWSLASGSSLPAGLSLSSAGTISGTPTTVGTATFTVKVTDASGGEGGPVSQTQQLSITITPGPLTITTTSLPEAVVNEAYSAPLQASGGNPPYTWTVANGSSLPAWLSLGGSGTSWKVYGTPTATGSSSFSLTVSDSTTPTAQSQTQALSVKVVTASQACGTGYESILKGQYAFSLRGWNSLNGFMAAIGSFTADGNGHITAGKVDSNGVSLGVKSGNITAGSSYSVGPDNRGCATIVTPFYTFTTRLALDHVSGVATAGSLEEWDSSPSPYIAVGKILLQKSIPAKLPAGNWVFQQTGIYSTAIYRTGVVGVIKADGNGNITDGEYDSSVLGHFKSYSGLSGTYSNADPTTGRFTEATTLKGVTIHRVDYLVSSTKFLELVSDTLGSSNTVLIGEGQPQSGSLTVSGKLVYYASGLVDSLGNGNSSQFGLLTVTGSSAFTAHVYEDYAGTWTPNTLTCSYSIDSYGKLLVDYNGCFNYYVSVYLTGPNAGVLLGYDSGVLDGQLEPQSATSLASGAYFFGTSLEPINFDEETQVGVVTLTSGGVTGSSDETSPGSPQQADQPVSETYTVNSDGTFSTSENLGVVSGIIVSKSEIVAVGNQSSAFPTILLIKNGP